jgi:fibronectin type 3 domain-containing protein
MRRFLTLVTGMITTLVVAVPAIQVLSSPPANAVELGSLSAQISSSWQANATVWKMAYGAGDIWMVGDFTSLRPPGAALGTGEQPANYFAALNASTGAPDPAVNDTHTFTGQASGTLPLSTGAVAVSPNGSTVYVGGNFTTVDGLSRNHIAAFSTATGALLPWNPGVGGVVRAITVSPDSNTVYVGGSFGKVGKTTVGPNVAAIDATTGAALAWGPTPPGTDNTVVALGVSADGSQVVIGGYFSQVDGLTQSADGATVYNKAAIIGGVTSSTPGALEPMPADVQAVPPGTDAAPVNGCTSDVKAIVISGGAAYIADEGTGGGCFDGTWAVNLSDGSLKWVNRCLGATQTLAVVGNFLYKGSHIHDCVSRNTNGDPDNFPQVPVNQNRHVTSEFISNGFLGPWYPDMNAGPNLGPRAMATDGTQLYVGGDFTSINHVSQQGIARFTTSNDYPTPKPATPLAVPSGTNSVNIFAQAPVDLDDPDLTLELFRDSGSTPIATANVHSLFWKQPVIGFTDSGLATGSQHSYRVQAIETNGTGSSPLSPASPKVTVGTSSSTYAATVLSQNPAGYWRLGESSGTIGADSSPSLNGGVYTGGVTVGTTGAILGDPDTAMTLDGSSGYFSSSQLQPGPTVYSEEAWFKTTTTRGGKIMGFGTSQTGNSNSYDRHIYMTNNGQLIFGAYTGTTNTIQTSKSYNDGNWHQVIATQGPGGMVLYVDGLKVGSNPQTGNQSYSGYWRVGEDNLAGWPSAPTSYYFNGSIDDASVYNTALTPAQVAAQYTAAGYTLPTPPGSNTPYAQGVLSDGPSLYWRLDESSGTTATDISGYVNNGKYGSGDTLKQAGAITDGTSPADTAVALSGSNNGVMVSSNATPSPTAYSIEAWFKTSSANGKIVGFGNSSSATGSSSDDKHIYFNNNVLNFGVNNGSRQIISTPTSLHLADGLWHHVVATQDSTGMKLYVDGSLVASNGVTSNQAYTGYWHVGGDTGWGTVANLTGSVDEVAIYPYALLPTEVLSDYDLGTGQRTTPLPPPAPAAPTVTSLSQSTAKISWRALPDASSYTVQRSIAGANNFAPVATNVLGTSYADGGLNPGTSYDYEVIANNAGGSSAPSPITTLLAAPGQPGLLTAAPNGPTEIDLSWGAASGATSYDVRRGPGGSGTFPTDLGPVTGTTYADTGLSPASSFDYEVVPSNSSGPGPASNTATGTTVPAQVTGAVASVVSASEVDLSWNTAAGASTYVVQRAPSSTSNWTVVSSASSATSFADKTVSAGTAYDYRIAGVDSGGNGAFSTTQTVLTLPGKPGTLTAVPNGSTEIDLSWGASSGATSYDVQRSPSGQGIFTDLGSVAGTTFPDMGLTAGVSYDYYVVPSNATGPGAASNVATGSTLPAQVAGLTANVVSSSEIDLAWNSAAGATSYVVQRAPSGTTNWATVSSGSSATSFADTGVNPGTAYDYQVAGVYAGGTGPFSSTQTALTFPGKPGALTATVNGTGEIDLSWGASTGASSYDVQRGPGGSGTFPTDLGSVTGTTAQDTGLNPGDSYDYRVVPSNASGPGAASNTVTGTTLPAQVTGLNANAVSGSEVDLSWNSAAGAVTYLVQRAPSGTTNWAPVSSGSSLTSYQDLSVSPATPYDYRVAAVDAGGTGAFSSTQTATTPQVAPGQVTGVSTNAVSPTEVDLSWNSLSGATAYEIDRSTTSATSGFSPVVTGLTGTSYADKTVSQSTQYWYEVIGSNSAGPGLASSASVVTTPAVNLPLLANSFEGGTNGTAVTAANSGGASGNALNAVSCSAGTVTYSTASAAHGSVSALASPGTGLCYVQWSKSITPTNEAYGRAYLNLSANPAGAFVLLKATDASFGRDIQVNLSKTGKLSILDAAGTTQATFTNSVPLNSWVRLEWHVIAAASGTVELRMYAGDSATPIESHLVTGVNTGTTIGAYQLGALSSVSGGLGATIGIDDLAYGTSGWLGTH